MSQLCQDKHRQRLTTSTYTQPPVPGTRPNPLSSHPPTPIEFSGVNWPEHNHNHNQNQRARKHEREVSTWSLPFATSPSNSVPNNKHPSNFSTPDLSKSASPSIESLSHDLNSSNPHLGVHQLPLAYQLRDPLSDKSDLSNAPIMSPSHDNRHDSFGSSLPVPKAGPPQARRRSISMQKLFSLSNLKSGFSSSRTSLVSNNSTHQQPPKTAASDRPVSNSTTSSRGVKRVADDDHPMQTAQHNLQPPLRKRKSNSWFRRKSGLFTFGSQNGSAVDDYDIPQGPDAMMLDEPESTRSSDQRTASSSEPPVRNSSITTTTNTQNTQPPILPPLSPMSKTQTGSSQYSRAQRPVSSRTLSSQSRASSQGQQTYSPPTREAFSPPPTLPELGRLETSFGDSDMGDLFARIGR